MWRTAKHRCLQSSKQKRWDEVSHEKRQEIASFLSDQWQSLVAGANADSQLKDLWWSLLLPRVVQCSLGAVAHTGWYLVVAVVSLEKWEVASVVESDIKPLSFSSVVWRQGIKRQMAGCCVPLPSEKMRVGVATLFPQLQGKRTGGIGIFEARR